MLPQIEYILIILKSRHVNAYDIKAYFLRGHKKLLILAVLTDKSFKPPTDFLILNLPGSEEGCALVSLQSCNGR